MQKQGKIEILCVKNAVKYFGNSDAATRALGGVSFTVYEEEFVAVMGPSGSGKSTLLNVIATLEPLSGGEIVVDGEPVSSMKEKDLSSFRRDRLGFVFQDYNLIDTLTAEENIALPLALTKTDVGTVTREVCRVSEVLGVSDQLKKFPSEMSGGQRQRVACARAVVASPALVLADEPTGALDSKNSRLLMEQFRRMNETLGASILMVTHDASAACYADRVLFLKDGKIYDEIYRGERERKEFYHEIATVIESLGGETDAV